MSSNQKKVPTLTVDAFCKAHGQRLQLTLHTSSGCKDRIIRAGAIHRPGLALAGFVDRFSFKHIQILGNTENAFINQLPPKILEGALQKVMCFDIPCMIFTHGNRPPERLLQIASERKICVFSTPLPTTEATQLIGMALEEVFAPHAYVHGTLVDVYGAGILLTGASGIGKTEVALDLVKRGHRLVADDVVTISKRAGGLLIGRGNDLLQHCMEIRGVGILDTQAVFGIRGIRKQKRVEVIVELKEWDANESYERLGLEDKHQQILGENLPLVQLAIFPGKAIAVIVEVIALNQMLKFYGYHPAKALESRLNKKMGMDTDSMPIHLDPDCE